jgi:hypothetical protein
MGWVLALSLARSADGAAPIRDEGVGAWALVEAPR